MAQQPKLGSPIRSWWIGCDEQRFYRFRLYSSTVSTRYKYQKLEFKICTQSGMGYVSKKCGKSTVQLYQVLYIKDSTKFFQ